MKTFLTFAFAAMLGSLALPNNASAIVPGHPRVNEVNGRLNNEQRRINNGVATGRLSFGQANRLERGEQHIQRQEFRDRAAHNGHLTFGEMRRLNHEENREAHRINHAEASRGMLFHRWSRGR